MVNSKKYDRNIHGRIRLLAPARRAPQLRVLPNYRDQQCARWVLVAVVHSRRWFGQVRGVFFVPGSVLGRVGRSVSAHRDPVSMHWHLQRRASPVGWTLFVFSVSWGKIWIGRNFGA